MRWLTALEFARHNAVKRVADSETEAEDDDEKKDLSNKKLCELEFDGISNFSRRKSDFGENSKGENFLQNIQLALDLKLAEIRNLKEKFGEFNSNYFLEEKKEGIKHKNFGFFLEITGIIQSFLKTKSNARKWGRCR